MPDLFGDPDRTIGGVLERKVEMTAEDAKLLGLEVNKRRMFTFHVLGAPAPKGSSRAILIGGKARNVPSGSNVNRDRLKSWDTAIREAARSVVGDVTAPPFLKTALVFEVEFKLARPSGHWGARGLKPSAPRFPIGKPDGDKLARQAADSLAGIIFDDDCRIVDWLIRKRWADPGREGAHFTITEAI